MLLSISAGTPPSFPAPSSIPAGPQPPFLALQHPFTAPPIWATEITAGDLMSLIFFFFPIEIVEVKLVNEAEERETNGIVIFFFW